MTSTAESSTTHSWVAFVSVAGCLTMSTLGANLPSPIYPIYQSDFGLSPLAISFAFASYALALIPSLILSGSLSDAIGRKPVLLTSLVFGIVGSLVLCLTGGLGLLIFGRALQGVAVGTASGAASGALRETHPHGNDSQAAQISSAAMVGGGAIGPILAGLLVQYLPWPRQLAYLLHLVLLLGLVAMVIGSYRSPAVRTVWKAPVPRVARELMPQFISSTAASSLAWAVTALFMALVPSMMHDTLKITSAVAAGGIVAVVLGTSAVMQFVAQAWDSHRVQVLGLPAVVLGLILLMLAQSLGSIWTLLISATVAGVGQGLVFLGATKSVNLAAPNAILGNVTSAYFMGVYLGVAVPVIGVGFFALITGLIGAVLWFTVIIGLSCIAVTVWLWRLRKKYP